jgi:16S rRNA (uracil1498-N3)-methyltransferase
MEYYYLAAPAGVGESVRFAPDESRHIARVRRHRNGDRVRATDGRGIEYLVEVSDVGDDAVSGRVLSAVPGRGEPGVRVTLAQGILKGDHLALVVEAVTQLGVASIVPFRSARTVGGFRPGRAERLRKVALGAMKCSRRSVLPEIHDALEFDALAARCGEYDAALVAWEGETTQALDRKLVGDPVSVMVVVGPEGGFEESEIETLRHAGARSCSLGSRPLRAELAGTVAVTELLCVLGEMVPPGNAPHGKEV